MPGALGRASPRRPTSIPFSTAGLYLRNGTTHFENEEEKDGPGRKLRKIRAADANLAPDIV